MSEAEAIYIGTGRRKTSSARVHLKLGKDTLTVNDQPIENYFSGKLKQGVYLRAFKITNTLNRFGGSIKVFGGGAESQLEAVLHGISRALLKFDPSLKPQLRKNKLLTRDSRMKESRKYGLAHAARAKKSSPKR
ncbi:MAG: 30S ribosomal protein S9 [bacterium]|nr:30S ribosomal protein S9 [bacterium]